MTLFEGNESYDQQVFDSQVQMYEETEVKKRSFVCNVPGLRLVSSSVE